MAEVTLNQNIAECLRSASDFGSTTVHNICTGATSLVPWGTADWAGAGALVALAAVFIIMLAALAAVIIRDTFFW